VARKNPKVEEADEAKLEVTGHPKTWAAGVPGVYHSMKPALEHMGLERSRKTLLALNQKDGFDCMSCAWPDPGHRGTFEFCENGARAVTWEATPVVTVLDEFLGRASRSANLLERSEYWLGHAGPPHRTRVQARRRATITSAITWDEAFRHHRR
jgi:hypothetical protein